MERMVYKQVTKWIISKVVTPNPFYLESVMDCGIHPTKSVKNTIFIIALNLVY